MVFVALLKVQILPYAKKCILMFAHLWNKVRQFQLSFSLDQIFFKKIHKAIFILLFSIWQRKTGKGPKIGNGLNGRIRFMILQSFFYLYISSFWVMLNFNSMLFAGIGNDIFTFCSLKFLFASARISALGYSCSKKWL